MKMGIKGSKEIKLKYKHYFDTIQNNILSFFNSLKYKNSVPFIIYSNSVKIVLLWLLITTIELISSIYILIQYKLHMEVQLESFKTINKSRYEHKK